MKGKHWTYIKVLNDLEMKNEQAAELQTDGSIRRKDLQHLQGRQLESISSSWIDNNTDDSMDSKGVGNWNQFEANQKIQGYNPNKAHFDENLYTTALDKNKLTKAKIQEANRLAADIEKSSTGNTHLQEERGQRTEGGDGNDEEALSAVLGTGGYKKGQQPDQQDQKPWKRGARLTGSQSQHQQQQPQPQAQQKPQQTISGIQRRDKNAPWGAATAGVGGSTAPPPGLSFGGAGGGGKQGEEREYTEKEIKEEKQKESTTDEKNTEETKPKLSAASKPFVPSAAAAAFVPKAPKPAAVVPTLAPPAPPMGAVMIGPNGQPMPMQMTPDGQPMQFMVGPDGVPMQTGAPDGMAMNMGQPMMPYPGGMMQMQPMMGYPGQMMGHQMMQGGDDGMGGGAMQPGYYPQQGFQGHGGMPHSGYGGGYGGPGRGGRGGRGGGRGGDYRGGDRDQRDVRDRSDSYHRERSDSYQSQTIPVPPTPAPAPARAPQD